MKNHLGYPMQQTWNGWKRAVKLAALPEGYRLQIDGDKDIACAYGITLSPGGTEHRIAVGEWDGAEGYISYLIR